MYLSIEYYLRTVYKLILENMKAEKFKFSLNGQDLISGYKWVCVVVVIIFTKLDFENLFLFFKIIVIR